VPGLILAAINPDNTPHGYNLTYAFPLVLFAVVTLILYLLFSRPHRRVPARRVSVASSAAPAPDVAQAASVAGGLSLAPGGGTTESHHEPAGAHLVASTNPEDLAPAERDSGDAKPTDAQPGDAQPGDAQPGDAQPGEAQPRAPQVGQGWQTGATESDQGADEDADKDADTGTPEAPE